MILQPRCSDPRCWGEIGGTGQRDAPYTGKAGGKAQSGQSSHLPGVFLVVYVVRKMKISSTF